MAGQPDGPQSDCPVVLTENSCAILPEIDTAEALEEVLLGNLTSVDGFSTPLSTGTVGASVGMLSCIELRQSKDVVKFGELKRDGEGGGEEVDPWKMEAKQDEGITEEVRRVSTGQMEREEVGQREGDWVEIGQNVGAVEELRQMVRDSVNIKQMKGEREEVGQVEVGQEEAAVGEVEPAEGEEVELAGEAREEVDPVEGDGVEAGAAGEEVGPVEGDGEEAGPVEGD
eukprot:g39736.t1